MTTDSFMVDGFYDSLPQSSIQSKGEVFKKILLVIIVMLMLFGLVWVCLIKTMRPLADIEINGIPSIERELVFRYAEITNKTSFFSVNISKMEKQLENLAMVESAHVAKQFPDKIYIRLNPRIPVAISLASLDEKSTPIFIDRHGVVCKIGVSDTESKMQVSMLPIISGLTFDDLKLGTRLPLPYRRVLESIESIYKNNPLLLSSVSEINFQKKKFDGFELILYPADSNVKVRIGSELNEETLKYMMLMIDIFNDIGTEVDEIDFRTGTASYKGKEALIA
jgi:cell division protein FtsQ